MNYINLTPHAIVLNSGTVFQPSGNVARVHQEFKDAHFQEVRGPHIFETKFGDIENLPVTQIGVRYIVSGVVLAAAKEAGREDCVAPATGHPETVRNEKGHILSVPGFIL